MRPAASVAMSTSEHVLLRTVRARMIEPAGMLPAAMWWKIAMAMTVHTKVAPQRTDYAHPVSRAVKAKVEVMAHSRAKVVEVMHSPA